MFNLYFYTILSNLVIVVITDSAPLHITFEPSSDQVRLNEQLIVRCELDAGSNIDTGTSVFLFCPISPWESFCFQNCKSACAAESPGQCPYGSQLGQVSCRTVVEQNGQVTYEYTIQNLSKDWLGHMKDGFYCKSAGSRTEEIWLIEAEDSVTNPPQRSSIAPERTQDVLETATPTTVKPKYLEEGGLAKMNYMDEKTSATLRELLVIFAIIIVFVSVSINVFCCIRCALIRQYSRGKEPPRMQNLFCMTEEIRNARLACRGFPDYWDAERPDILYQKPFMTEMAQSHHSQLQQLLPDRNYITPGLMRPLIPANSSVFMSPDLITSTTRQQLSMFSDTNSSCGPTDQRRVLTGGENALSGTPESSVILSRSGRQSQTASVVLVQGPNGLQLIRKPSSVGATTSPLAAAVANYCAQQQHNLIELQRQLSTHEFSGAASSRGGSDGMASCLDSVGVPDSVTLGTYTPSTSIMTTLKQTASNEVNMPNPTETNSEDTFGGPSSSMGDSHVPDGLPQQTQINGSHSNPQISSSFPTSAGLSSSHSDSGNGSGSGQFPSAQNGEFGSSMVAHKASCGANHLITPNGNCGNSVQKYVRETGYTNWLQCSAKFQAHANSLNQKLQALQSPFVEARTQLFD